MKNIKQNLCQFILSALLVFTASEASAGLLSGHRLGFQWYLGDSPYDNQEIININPEGNLNIVSSRLMLNITDSQIKLNSYMLFSSYFNNYPFNGFVLSDIDNSIPDFSSIEIDNTTNLDRFNDSRITVSPNSIAINLQFLNNYPGMQISLTLHSNHVDEPSSWLLMLISVLGVLVFRAYRISYTLKAPR